MLFRSLMSRSTATRGLSATLLRDGIPHGVWFVAYDVCKTSLMEASTTTTLPNVDTVQSNEERSVPVSVSLPSGAVAATVAWGVGYPADLIKTRIQAASTPHAPGILETARHIIRESNGLAGLYRGFGMKLVRSVPASKIGRAHV